MTPFLKLLYSFSHGRKAHGGVDGVGALHRDGGGGKAALRGGLKVRAVEERAGDGSHEGVAAAGGIDHARGGGVLACCGGDSGSRRVPPRFDRMRCYNGRQQSAHRQPGGGGMGV